MLQNCYNEFINEKVLGAADSALLLKDFTFHRLVWDQRVLKDLTFHRLVLEAALIKRPHLP